MAMSRLLKIMNGLCLITVTHYSSKVGGLVITKYGKFEKRFEERTISIDGHFVAYGRHFGKNLSHGKWNVINFPLIRKKNRIVP